MASMVTFAFRPLLRRRIRAFIAVTALAPALALVVSPANQAAAAATLLSQGQPATASSVESASFPASAAVDGNTGTRWSSAFADPQWLQVDLGVTASITQVVLQWEAAYATAFQIQTSNDATNWTTIFATTTGTGGTQTVNVTGSGRYVRMLGTARATQYGYSLWEFQVYGSPSGGTCGTADAALNRPATASSTENASFPASAAVDGNTGTRWSSAFSDPQWLQVDLGSTANICQVTLNWEAAYATAFQIQTSNDATNWTTIFTTTTGTGGNQTLNVTGSGRYVRMLGTARATQYGYSLWEFGVFTTGGGGGGGTCPAQSNTPNLGPNVFVFDPGMSSSSIQSTLDSVFNTQKLNQFGTQRYALLFKPGTYSVEANIGYYTSIAGLGQNPDDVTINGDVTVDAFDGTGNATQNFWRSAENMAINPSAGSDRWAVAQAGPFRRMDVHGGLELYPASFGFASGGYIADTKVTGQVSSVSQQQWYSRDSNFGSWSGSVWNMVFSGVNGAPAQSFPSPPMTTLATTPVSRDVPYLYVDSSGNYHVFEPSLRTSASGPSWANGPTPGTSVPMSQFFVASPSMSAATINTALSQGCNVLFTPGVYNINQTLNVTHADTTILGIGFPTLIPQNGVNTMQVSDVNGVRIKGLLFDAGTTNSPALLTVGTAGSTVSHASDPVSVQDVFFRVGGDIAGKATASLVVNANDTIVDDVWAWRADHGNSGTVGWTTNTADNGMTVNGNNVEATGLFVEHYQKTEVAWNGQNGKIIFFQNEMPYDPPNQAAWMNGSSNGYPAIAVASNVTSFGGWGLGSYCFFNVNPAVSAADAYSSPNTAGVAWHDLLTVSLNNQGSITHVINSTGAATPTNTTPRDEPGAAEYRVPVMESAHAMVRGGWLQPGLRVAGAGLLAATAAIHLDLYLTGFKNIPTIGPLFLLQIIAGFALAIAVLATGNQVAAALGAGFAVATLGGYLLSIWVGLFGFTEVRTTAGIVAGIIEVAAFAVLGLLAITPAGRAAPGHAGGRGGLGQLLAGLPMARPAIGLLSVVALVLLIVAVAGAGTSTGSSGGGGTAALKTGKVGGVTVLTNAKGLTLYTFAADSPGKSNCYGSCAQYWPPVTGTPSAAGIPGRFGTTTRTDGTKQVTWNGHPLYTYVGDHGPGQAAGNNLNINGGLWKEIVVSH